MVLALLTSALMCPPSIEHEEMMLEGWSLHVDKKILSERPRTWEAARKELQSMLIQIERVVPDAPLAKLKSIPLWIHLNVPSNPGAAYHPSAEWLSEHGFDPHMAHGIEFGNLENLVSWSYQQPYMALHEMAHAYHFLFLPKLEDNPDVEAAYKAAVASRRYESVLWADGGTRRAYALTNKMEYFAETTESYLGQNDGFPFIRAELKTFDPTGYDLMRKVWGDPVVKVPSG